MWNRLRSWDLWIYLILALIACASFLVLWRPELLGLSGQQAGLPSSSVGLVFREGGQVRRKANGSVVWRDLFRPKASVDAGDTIYTGTDGKARIAFDNGLRAELDPNSMMVVQQDAREFASGWLGMLQRIRNPSAPAFKLKHGAIHFESTEANHPIVIQAHGKTYRLDPLRGRGQVTVSLQKTAHGEQLQVSTLPQAQVRVTQVGSQAQPIDVSGKRTALLMLAKSPVALPELSHGVDTSWNLPTLDILAVKASTQVRKRQELHEIPVRIRWKPMDEATGYAIEVFHGSDLVLSRQNLKASSLDFKLTRLDTEPYSYQITVSLKTGEKIETRKKPILLEYASPVLRITARKVRRGQKTLITWSRTSLTPKYRIQIARDPGFSHLLLNQETSINLLLYPARDSGRHFVRVKSLTEAHPSAWSQAKSFEVD